MALLDGADGCFLEVDAWNDQERWERETHPDSYPGSAIEDCAYWLAKSRAALEAASPYLTATPTPAEVWDEAYMRAVTDVLTKTKPATLNPYRG